MTLSMNCPINKMTNICMYYWQSNHWWNKENRPFSYGKKCANEPINSFDLLMNTTPNDNAQKDEKENRKTS